MRSKIEWYKEVLASDPTSKMFYPLAKLYAESGMLESAAEVLQKGITRHPDYLEAKLLLIEILNRIGRIEEARVLVDEMERILARYAAFWTLWADKIGERSPDAALAINFINSFLDGETLTWVSLMEQGLRAELNMPPAERKQPEAKTEDFVFEPASVLQVEKTNSVGSLRTRTMADLLVEQGDYQGALDIYRELYDIVPEGSERDDLSARIENMKARIEEAGGSEENPAKMENPDFTEPLQKAKRKLLSALTLLADRLEARANA